MNRKIETFKRRFFWGKVMHRKIVFVNVESSVI